MDRDEINIPQRGRPRKTKEINFGALQGDLPERTSGTAADFEKIFEDEEESVSDLLQKEYRKYVDRNNMEINRNNLESYLKLGDSNRKWSLRNEKVRLDPRRSNEKHGMFQSPGQMMSHISSIFPEKSAFGASGSRPQGEERKSSENEKLFKQDQQRAPGSSVDERALDPGKPSAGAPLTREDIVPGTRQQKNDFLYPRRYSEDYGAAFRDRGVPGKFSEMTETKNFVQGHAERFRQEKDFAGPRTGGRFYPGQGHPGLYDPGPGDGPPYAEIPWGFGWEAEQRPYPPQGREGHPGEHLHSFSGGLPEYLGGRGFEKSDHFQRPGKDFGEPGPGASPEKRPPLYHAPGHRGFQDDHPFWESRKRAREFPDSSFYDQAEGTLPAPKYAGGTSLGQTLSHSSNVPNFEPDPSNPLFQNYSIWVNRKKRRNNPLLWQYINQSSNLMHPSKYSSLDYVHKKMYLGTITQLPVEKNNHQILPLFLNSASSTPEFLKIGRIFLERTKALNYDNVTVMQLKNLMKEFGLCHNGKKTELIERVRTTASRIETKMDGKKAFPEDPSPETRAKSPEQNKKQEATEEEATFMYF